MITLDVKIDPVEFIKLNYRQVYTQPIVIVFFISSVFLLGYSWIDSDGDTGKLASSFIAVIAAMVMVYLLLLLPIVLFYRAKYTYTSLPELHQKIRYKVNEKGLEIKGETIKKSEPWSAYHRVFITPHWIVVTKPKSVGLFIPKDVFKSDEELQEFLGYAKAGGLVGKF